jgi:signal transduction histidine kinase
LGIGLALVRSLVELHGGSVTAASAGAGQGSEFAVCLPMAL